MISGIPKINIFDRTFTPFRHPGDHLIEEEFELVHNEVNFDGITIFTDHCFQEVQKANSKYSVAWQVESPYWSDYQFDLMMNNTVHLFDIVITYREELVLKDPDKFKRGNWGGTWIKSPNLNLDKKDKSVIILHSGKDKTDNQKLRAQIVESGLVDASGGYKGRRFVLKDEVISPYKFEVVIENVDHPNYFSEKLTDSIASGCIPIYKGCTNIEDYFNMDGIITFDTFEELKDIIPTLNDKLFSSMRIPQIENFNNVVDNFRLNEDWIYLNYLKDLI